MHMPRRSSKVLSVVVTSILLLPGAKAVFGQPDSAAKPVVVTAIPPSDSELADTREQLLALLRMSPTLTEVVETDPTLLADQEYVSRTNPQLAQFLAQHLEVTRNPDFYLFANLTRQRGPHVDSLSRRVRGRDTGNDDAESRRRFLLNVLQIPMFVAIIGVFAWLIRMLLQNRRWGRVFRMQSEVHAKLLDRFASSEELLQYMSTEPGKRFLEAAPIPIEFEHDKRLPGGLGRVLPPLQIGIVLTLLGAGLLVLQRSRSLPDISAALLVFGMITMMPGIGFIISAIITWRISAHLGLMPQPSASSSEPNGRQ
jgi:hypothetical protein